MKRLSVVGLGKLGQGLAACLADRGFDTLGIDIDPSVVDSINRGIATVVEPGLSEMISRSRGRLRASLDHQEAIDDSDVTCVLVATPSEAAGNFSNKYLESAMISLSQSLKQSSKPYHLFIINSTVMPGSVGQQMIPILEKFSGRRLNEGFGVCYCPELVALGRVLKDFLNPDMVVIGESDRRAGEIAADIYGGLCQNNPPIYRMSIINAELMKINLNCYVTLKISFANSLANLCEKIPGANVDVITQALGADKRIAPAYLQGGLSFGGTCFPRDTKAFIALSERYGMDAQLMTAVERVNDFQDKHLAGSVLEQLRSLHTNRVSVLGLSFKPNTPVIEKSPAITLIGELLAQGVEVFVYDPLAMENTRATFGDKIKYSASATDCTMQSPVCVITTTWDEFRLLEPKDFPQKEKPVVVFDCWRILREKLNNAPHIRYIPLGIGTQDSPLSSLLPDTQKET